MCVACLSLLVSAPPAKARRASAMESPLLTAMNAARSARGLAPLTVDPVLERAAVAHSADMVRRQYFDHGPFASRLRAFGARGPRFGETLSWTSGMGARSIIADWLSSPPHRAILLRPGFIRVGVGAVHGRFQGWSALLVTADFAGS
jgi:uncharacterized protein YkwD